MMCRKELQTRYTLRCNTASKMEYLIFYWISVLQNHGADPACTNRFIPDNGNAIYRGRVGRDRNEVLSHYKEFLVADLGVSPFGQQAGNLVNEYPKPGFQNAPNFCKDTDRSLGTYSFNVPATLAPGMFYTIIYIFN